MDQSRVCVNTLIREKPFPPGHSSTWDNKHYVIFGQLEMVTLLSPCMLNCVCTAQAETLSGKEKERLKILLLISFSSDISRVPLCPPILGPLIIFTTGNEHMSLRSDNRHLSTQGSRPNPSLPSLPMEMFQLQISIRPLGLMPNFEQVGMGWVLVVYFLIALSWVMKIFSFFMHKAHAARGTRFPPWLWARAQFPPRATLSAVLRSFVISVLLIALEQYQAF